MAAKSPSQIVNALNRAFQDSGGTPYFISDKVSGNPKRFKVLYHGEIVSIWVYIWNLTHGGGSRLATEFRIQMTGVSPPLALNPKGLTVLLGYYSDGDIFAGFDLTKHKTFTPGSSSIQINISAINAALQDGLSFVQKENKETAIGIRSDQLITYCINATSLHENGYYLEIEETNLLTRAAQSQVSIGLPSESLSPERERLVTTVSRYSRDSRFRKIVTSAYDNRCSVTRAQLKLIDAAHILPVISDGSVDCVNNGIALSPTYHRAYDNCLIYLDENMVMRLNEEKLSELRAVELTDGLEHFKSFLDHTIHLPQAQNDRPSIELIKRANKYRRIPGYI